MHAVSFFFYDWVLKKSLAHLLQVSRSNSSMPCQFLGLLPRLTSTLSSLLGSLNFFSWCRSLYSTWGEALEGGLASIPEPELVEVEAAAMVVANTRV